MKKRARAEQNHRQKTAAGNLEAVYSEYPEIKEMINLQLREDGLPDPFEKDTNQASRLLNKKSSP